MARADLMPGIDAFFDPVHDGWRVWIPREVIEEQMNRLGQRMDRGQCDAQSGRGLGMQVARVLAAPGPIQRAVRARIAKNNRRRFGP